MASRWHEILAQPPVALVARVLARRYGVELGVIDAGEPVPDGDAVVAPVDGGRAGALAVRELPRQHHAERALVAELVVEAARAATEHLAATRPPARRSLGGRARTEPVVAEPPRPTYPALIGQGVAMQALYRLLDRVVASDSTVLITGENGTGKELVARAVHQHSARRQRRFVVQNCSAFNDNLLDSELFGHKRGAFTGAIADKQGLFEVADQGTFFLDEIGDMSPSLQVKVLRVLQEGTFTPVGDTEPRKVDVRIIAATNRDLTRMVERGEFREDLYYRIHVINLVMPPLRERRDDLEVLCDHFLVKHRRSGRPPKRLSPAGLERLARYPWPGNVRELENEIERLIVLSGDDPVIDAPLLSPRIRDDELASSPGLARSLPEAIDVLERSMIRDALASHAGNKTRAAVQLGISRRNLIRLAQKYDLD